MGDFESSYRGHFYPSVGQQGTRCISNGPPRDPHTAHQAA